MADAFRSRSHLSTNNKNAKWGNDDFMENIKIHQEKIRNINEID